MIFAPEIIRSRGTAAEIQLFVQYAYWTFLSLFVISNWSRFKLMDVSKYLLFGTLGLIISFYFGDHQSFLTLWIVETNNVSIQKHEIATK